MNVHFAGRFAALLLFASLCTNVLAQPLLERAKTNVSSLQLVSDDISEYVNEIFKKPETTDEESSLADSLTRIQNWVIQTQRDMEAIQFSIQLYDLVGDERARARARAILRLQSSFMHSRATTAVKMLELLGPRLSSSQLRVLSNRALAPTKVALRLVTEIRDSY